jgi:TPR repeat protein
MGMMRSLVAVAVLLMALTGTACVQETPDERRMTAAMRIVAEGGWADAQTALGIRYALGKGVTRDYVEAARWLRTAAEHGQRFAQFNLGVLYASGNGVTQDDEAAYMWFSLAASQASGDERADYLSYRDRVVPLLTPQQVAEAQDRARDWQAAFEKQQGQRR